VFTQRHESTCCALLFAVIQKRTGHVRCPEESPAPHSDAGNLMFQTSLPQLALRRESSPNSLHPSPDLLSALSAPAVKALRILPPPRLLFP